MKNKKILHLTLKRKWFDLMVRGIKKVEYREMKVYWLERLCNVNVEVGHPDKFIKFDEIHMRNGYNKNSPYAIFKHIKTDMTSPKLIKYNEKITLHLQTSCYQIHLGELIELKNYTL